MIFAPRPCIDRRPSASPPRRQHRRPPRCRMRHHPISPESSRREQYSLRIPRDRLHLPTRIEHDAAACCLAEFPWGTGSGTSRSSTSPVAPASAPGWSSTEKSTAAPAAAASRSATPASATTAPSLRQDRQRRILLRGVPWANSPHGNSPPLATPPPPKISPNSGKLATPTPTRSSRLTPAPLAKSCANLGDLFRPDAILLGSLATHLGQNGWKSSKPNSAPRPFPTRPLRHRARRTRPPFAGLLRPRRCRLQFVKTIFDTRNYFLHVLRPSRKSVSNFTLCQPQIRAENILITANCIPRSSKNRKNMDFINFSITPSAPAPAPDP